MTKTRNIYLLRHGKTVGKAALNGSADIEVEQSEQQQIALELMSFGVSFTQVFSSPLKRCSELAELVADRNNIPLHIVPELQEMDFGDFDGVPFDELEQQWSTLESIWLDPANHTLPNAESLCGFRDRVVSGWTEVLSTESDNILVVTHGGVIRVLLAHLLDVDWQNPSRYSCLTIDNASVSQVQVMEADGKQYAAVKSVGLQLK